MNGKRAMFSWGWWAGSVSSRVGLIMTVVVALTVAVAVISLRGLSALSSQLDVTVAYQSKACGLVGRMLGESRRLSDAARTGHCHGIVAR